MSFWLSQMDAVDWLASLPNESVDMVSVDPAYESLEKHRAVGTTTRLKHSAASSNDWFAIFKNDRFPALFAELHRVMKRQTHLYFFCDQETMFIAKPIGEAAGFRFRKPLVWDKQKIGMGYSYRARYEFVLYFEKGPGKRRLNDLSIPDVLRVERVRNGYPTEKPVELNEIFVKQSTQPGEIVIDPFMGSGSAGVAACKNGRVFWGNDLSPKSVEITRARLAVLGESEAAPVFDTAPPPPQRGDGASSSP